MIGGHGAWIYEGKECTAGGVDLGWDLSAPRIIAVAVVLRRSLQDIKMCTMVVVR